MAKHNHNTRHSTTEELELLQGQFQSLQEQNLLRDAHIQTLTETVQAIKNTQTTFLDTQTDLQKQHSDFHKQQTEMMGMLQKILVHQQTRTIATDEIQPHTYAFLKHFHKFPVELAALQAQFEKLQDITNQITGRIWAGHNILRFDCARIREAFAEINKPPPEPKGTLDSLVILTEKFGRRAGNMKMASLATYFGLGQQTHRSLDDVRMNLEVLKYCATVLFLESSLPEIFPENSRASPDAIARDRNNRRSSHQDLNSNTPPPSNMNENLLIPSTLNRMIEDHPILNFVTPSTSETSSDQSESNPTRRDPFDMGPLSDEVHREELPSDDSMDEETSGSASRESSTESTPASIEVTTNAATQESSTEIAFAGTTDTDGFFEVDVISLPSISVVQIPFFRGTQKIQIFHNDAPLQLLCKQLKVRFGVSFSKFVDYAGRPRLTLVVNTTPSLCRVLDAIDNLAQKLSTESGSNSEWRPMVIRKPGFLNSPTLRLNLLTTSEGDMFRWVTEIYREGERLQYSRSDATELDSISSSGSFVDAYFALDTYDYQQNAGIRLVAKKLIVHSN